MRAKKLEERVTGSYSIPKPVREDLKSFSHYANRTESEVISMALEAYFKSDQAFSDLRAAEQSKREWFQNLYDDCSDYQNLVCDKNLLCGRGE